MLEVQRQKQEVKVRNQIEQAKRLSKAAERNIAFRVAPAEEHKEYDIHHCQI